MSRAGAVAAAVRLVVLAAVWWALSEGRVEYAGYGLLAVPLATLASLRLYPPQDPRGDLTGRAAALLGLVVWFVGRALAGGLDVALRSLRRPVDVRPDVVRVAVELPRGLAREVALGMVNLMPGTLVEDAGEDHADIHVLSGDLPVREQWADLQRRVARVAGHPGARREGHISDID